MDFRFTEEQEMLRDTVRRFVAKEIPEEKVKEIDEQDRFRSSLGLPGTLSCTATILSDSMETRSKRAHTFPSW
jgi:alkylation response protein AidB-like acyl-CoA dehydrogenase